MEKIIDRLHSFDFSTRLAFKSNFPCYVGFGCSALVCVYPDKFCKDCYLRLTLSK